MYCSLDSDAVQSLLLAIVTPSCLVQSLLRLRSFNCCVLRVNFVDDQQYAVGNIRCIDLLSAMQ